MKIKTTRASVVKWAFLISFVILVSSLPAVPVGPGSVEKDKDSFRGETLQERDVNTSAALPAGMTYSGSTFGGMKVIGSGVNVDGVYKVDDADPVKYVLTSDTTSIGGGLLGFLLADEWGEGFVLTRRYKVGKTFTFTCQTGKYSMGSGSIDITSGRVVMKAYHMNNMTSRAVSANYLTTGWEFTSSTVINDKGMYRIDPLDPLYCLYLAEFQMLLSGTWRTFVAFILEPFDIDPLLSVVFNFDSDMDGSNPRFETDMMDLGDIYQGVYLPSMEDAILSSWTDENPATGKFNIQLRAYHYGVDGTGPRTAIGDFGTFTTLGIIAFYTDGKASGGYRYVSVEYIVREATYAVPYDIYEDTGHFASSLNGQSYGPCQFLRTITPPVHDLATKTHRFTYRLSLYPLIWIQAVDLNIGAASFQFKAGNKLNLGKLDFINPANDESYGKITFSDQYHENWQTAEAFRTAYTAGVIGLPATVSFNDDLEPVLTFYASKLLYSYPVPTIDFTVSFTRRLPSVSAVNLAYLDFSYVSRPVSANYEVTINYKTVPALFPFFISPSSSITELQAYASYEIYEFFTSTWNLRDTFEDTETSTGKKRLVNLGLYSPGIHNFKIVVSQASIGFPVETKEISFSIDTTKDLPSGSWGTAPVEIYSPDLQVSGGSAYDKDGTVTITAYTTGITGATSYNVYLNKYDDLLDIWGEWDDWLLKSVDYTGGSLILFTVTSSEIATMLGFGSGVGSYRFSITPKSDAGISTEFTWGDTSGENAVAVTGSGTFTISTHVQVTLIEFTNPELRFKSGNSILSDSITTDTGIPDIQVTNFKNLPYLDADQIKYFQYEGVTPVFEDVGFYNPENNIIRVDLDDNLGNIETYATSADYSTMNILGRIKGISPFNFGTSSIYTLLRRVVDGSYSFDAVYEYDLFGFSDASNTLSMDVTTKRNILSGLSITSTDGQFSISWETITGGPSNPSNDYVTTDGRKYVIIYGKQGIVTPGDFTSDLSSMPSSNFHVLSWYDSENLVWTPQVFSTGQSGVIDGASGEWGSIGNIDFDEDTATYYMAVVPFFRILKSSLDVSTGDFSFKQQWYQGEISDVIQLSISKEIASSVIITPSKSGIPRKVYSQDTVTISGTASTLIGGYQPDSAEMTFRNKVGTEIYSSAMTKIGSDFGTVANVFDLTGGLSEIVGTVTVDFDFDSVSPGLHKMHTMEVKIITGIVGILDFISPGNYSVVRPTSTATTEFLFSMSAATDPSMFVYGLPRYDVESSDIELTSITVAGLNIGINFAGTDGRADRLADGFTWKLVIDDVYDLPSGLVSVGVEGHIDDGNVQANINGKLLFYLVREANFLVTSPSGLDPSRVIHVNTYAPFDVKWVTFFGTGIKPDKLELVVTKAVGGSYQAGNVIFSGVLTPNLYTYKFPINPLNHGMHEKFLFYVKAYKGSGTVIACVFQVWLDFEVFVYVDTSNFDYDQDDPDVNGDVLAQIPFTYPASYYWYVLDMGQPIYRPELYWIERMEGSTVTIINPIGIGRESPNYLPFDLSEFIPSQGQVDRLNYYISGPSLVKEDWDLSSDGSLFKETLSIISAYEFKNIHVEFTPSYVGIEYGPDSEWEVFLDGQSVTVTVDEVTNKVSFTVSRIGAGQKISVVANFYPGGAPTPEEPSNIWDVILAFILALIAAIAGLFGLSVRFSKRKSLNSFSM